MNSEKYKFETEFSPNMYVYDNGVWNLIGNDIFSYSYDNVILTKNQGKSVDYLRKNEKNNKAVNVVGFVRYLILDDVVKIKEFFVSKMYKNPQNMSFIWKLCEKKIAEINMHGPSLEFEVEATVKFMPNSRNDFFEMTNIIGPNLTQIDIGLLNKALMRFARGDWKFWHKNGFTVNRIYRNVGGAYKIIMTKTLYQ